MSITFLIPTTIDDGGLETFVIIIVVVVFIGHVVLAVSPYRELTRTVLDWIYDGTLCVVLTLQRSN